MNPRLQFLIAVLCSECFTQARHDSIEQLSAEWRAELEQSKQDQSQARIDVLNGLLASLDSVQGLATRQIEEEEQSEVIQVNSALASLANE